MHDNPENYALVWALGVLGQNPCINLNKKETCMGDNIAFGIISDCQLCVDNGYGWCYEIHNMDENEIIHYDLPSLAPLCIDPHKIRNCPYTEEEPIYNCWNKTFQKQMTFVFPVLNSP